jgi:hypothetical protein
VGVESGGDESCDRRRRKALKGISIGAAASTTLGVAALLVLSLRGGSLSLSMPWTSMTVDVNPPG